MQKFVIGMVILSSFSVSASEYIIKVKEGAGFAKSYKALNIKSDFTLAQGQFLVVDTTQSIADEIRMDENVLYIEPNYTYSINVSDPSFKKQWGLKNTGKNSGGIFNPGKKGVDINAENAWKVSKGDKNIKIAVIDTGVDYNHEDLKDNIMINDTELNGQAGVDDDGNGYVDDIYGYDFANNDNDPMDGHGHGTHCSGVIGASHNSIGIAGVMANVQILPVQFLASNGSGTLEGAIKAIDYAISRGVNIMSNSWGGGGKSQALEEAIKRAEDAGILFVAAAGNENNNNDTTATMPATIDLDNIVAVGAMDGKGKRASFSNYGKKTVDVFAPGVDIYSTVTNNNYKKMSGTSMACPFVSGIAGLIWANEPNLSFAEVKAKLMSNTHAGDKLDQYSASGFVDAFAAMTK